MKIGKDNYKKNITIVSGVLQFVAIIIYMIILRTIFVWQSDKVSGSGWAVIFLIIIAGSIQFLSVRLKEKYPIKVDKAENVMQRSKASYGWMALSFFIIIVLIFVIYIKFF